MTSMLEGGKEHSEAMRRYLGAGIVAALADDTKTPAPNKAVTQNNGFRLTRVGMASPDDVLIEHGLVT